MTSPTCEYLGDTIHLLRLEHNMTMEELAQKVGVTKATISRWESGEIQCVRSDRIKKLASVFGMTADELLQNQRKEQHPMPDIQNTMEPIKSSTEKLEKTIEQCDGKLNREESLAFLHSIVELCDRLLEAIDRANA